ncbi:MAG: hypothetical protein WDN23_21880 [Edaphobacter sp.]
MTGETSFVVRSSRVVTTYYAGIFGDSREKKVSCIERTKNNSKGDVVADRACEIPPIAKYAMDGAPEALRLTEEDRQLQNG